MNGTHSSDNHCANDDIGKACVDVIAPTTAQGSALYERVHAAIAKWLYIPAEDRDLIDFCFAVHRSNKLSGDKLWGMIIDGSGGGKTELLRAFRGREDSYFLSKISPKALSSGYRDNDNKGKDPSILPELNNKVLVIKDLSPVLSMRSDDRREILATLRDVYDGFIDEGKGNIGRVSYEVSFSCLTATTLAIENTSSVEQELGERFIKIRARDQDSSSKVRRALMNAYSDTPMREELKREINFFLDSISNHADVTMDVAISDELVKIATFTAHARSHVSRDRHGVLQYHPRPEVGTRLIKELVKLSAGLAVVRGRKSVTETELATVRRVADDCIPINRMQVIRALRTEKKARMCQLEKLTALPHSTVDRALSDLRELKIVKKHGNSAIEDDAQIEWTLVANA